ncbi:GNAT family N-acetyltransferase [Rhodococcus sovatensis]|uniref:GNAT family N-acetyltransferase n=1 Tax=Rhodococcus sovatensis TaxID=1805840 RepID=A0ABZ2PHK9_9NOCA
METGVETVVARIRTDPQSILAEWHELAERVGTVFSSRPGFVSNVVEATALACEYVEVRRGGRLAALAALSKFKRGPFTLAKVVGTGLGVPLEILSDGPEASDALLRAIADQGYMLSADSMIANDLTMQRLLMHASWNVHAPIRESVPVLELADGQKASSIRSAKSLKRLRQYRRGVTAFDVEMVTGVEHLESRWADIERVAASAVERNGRVNYLVPPHGEFAKSFLLSEARAGTLCVIGLVIDGVWSAHEVGLRTGTRMEGWLTHYDAGIGKLQPGHQMIEWFADHHDELGVRWLDQGVGINRIKTTWANSGYDVLRLSAVPNAWVLSGAMLRILYTAPRVLSSVGGAAARVGRRR